MRHLPQPQGFPELLPFGHQGDEAAVVGPQELAQHQQREELGLSEVMSRGSAAIGREGLTPDSQSLSRYPDGRLRHAGHRTLAFRLRMSSQRQPNQKVSTEQSSVIGGLNTPASSPANR
jgi:hypothetical protein